MNNYERLLIELDDIEVAKRELNMKYGNQLRITRKALGLSVLDVAYESGLSQQSVYNAEQGKHYSQKLYNYYALKLYNKKED